MNELLELVIMDTLKLNVPEVELELLEVELQPMEVSLEPLEVTLEPMEVTLPELPKDFGKLSELDFPSFENLEE